jgi:uncharacterized membrane protein
MKTLFDQGAPLPLRNASAACTAPMPMMSQNRLEVHDDEINRKAEEE